jgi:hypothetical protein
MSLFYLLALGLAISQARAGNPAPTDFQPDPRSVERYGPAYRYPQAGWIVLHIEGQPYDRGYQHGRLLAPEIAAYVRCFAANQSPTAPSEGWQNTRRLTNALFLRRYEKEYLEEMRGIADGATAAGAKFDNRPIDLVDIAAINVWPEIGTLDSGLEALPTGLEGMRFPHQQPRAMPEPKEMHCSAFAATGSATKDGKAIIGHITMFGLYPSNFFNVWIDVKPAKGHRVVIQGFPGGIQSGLDYYQNDAGLVITETTLAQTRFDINGMTLASRIRQAMQYADTIDKAVEILNTANNGLYTNEWLLADAKTNEIAMFELGTHKTRLYRSGKNDWFGGTEGFYWGCNNTKDLQVRLETIPGVQGRPENMVFCPSDRDKLWQRLFQQHKGKIDADFGKLAFTTPPLAAYHSLDAKFTTTDLAKDMKCWALFGPPLGRTWQPTYEERRRYPEIRPLISNPWTILHVNPPVKEPAGAPVAVDVPERLDGSTRTVATREGRRRRRPTDMPAWHGTLLPKTDADIWLVTAFAGYERLVAQEHNLNEHHEGTDGSGPRNHDSLAVSLYGYRSGYLAGARAGADVPLARTRSDVAKSDWYHVAAGKGVLVLQELRHQLGDTAFEEMMDSFGRAHAGKEVTVAEFQAHAERAAGKPLTEFFDYWLQQPALPALRLGAVTCVAEGKQYKVEGEILRDERLPRTTLSITLESAKGEELQTSSISLGAARTQFAIQSTKRPERVVVDKYGTTAKANGGVFTIHSFQSDLEHALIVYGTADEGSTNQETAENLQRAIITGWSNFTVPIRKDTEVTEDELKSHHVLLIGRPDSNPLVNRFRDVLPITFGSRSFTVRNEIYAHAGSAVIAAAENPLNPRYSLVVLAGLSAEATIHGPESWMGRSQAAEVVVLPNKGNSKALVLPARELVKELGQTAVLNGAKAIRTAGGK